MVEERDRGWLGQLPACQKCKVRKVKCDRLAPKCTSCTRGNTACVIVDPVTNERYARDYIYELEVKEKSLQQRLDGTNLTPTTTASADVGTPSAASTVIHTGFVGDGSSGLRFLHSILSNSKWHHHRSKILQQLTNRPQILERSITPNPLPPYEEACSLLENYLNRSYKYHKFLMRQDILEIFKRVYETSSVSPGPSQEVASQQDRFRIFMIFAISAVTRQRSGLSSEHPFGYYLAAEEYLSNIPLIKDLDAIQNLLLVSRFGIYYHIGTSLWEISQVCMRQCIEHGLHISPTVSLQPFQEQLRRCVFWECYILDRYSSGILGRPFAIPESEINVELPISVDDYTIQHTGAISLAEVPETHPSEISVFLSGINLRRISSRVHTAFYTGNNSNTNSTDGSSVPYPSIGHVYVAFYGFLKELEAWRHKAPVFVNPQTLYERPEWYDFLYEKDRLLLVRGVMHNVPKSTFTTISPPKELLVVCLDSAARVIEIYANMWEKKYVTWTRSYFQMLFTAGLSVLYCLSLGTQNDSTGDSTRTLNLCSTVLRSFKAKMPDAGSFAVVFDVLKDDFFADRVAQLNGEGSNTHNVGLDPRAQDLTNSALEHVEPSLPINLNFPTVPMGENSMLDLPGIAFTPSISQMHQGGHSETSELGQQIQDNWQTLTGEIMEQLEAGIGEYAWGYTNLDAYPWSRFEFIP